MKGNFMQYYLAPLEGITTYIYRRAYHQHFAAMDKYFTPFLVPHTKKGFSTKEKNDVMPEHSPGMNLVPQIMSNQAESFLHTVEKLKVYGYEEVNLNLGCPSKTVVSKGRGSGFLADPEGLDRFLDEIFEKCDVKISIKTRIGKDDPEEFARLLDIYNQYPVEELIIHPRVQQDFYKNHPNLAVFHDAIAHSKIPLCYNGDIFTPDDYGRMCREFPQVDTFMLGRGILMNPALLDMIRMKDADVENMMDKDMPDGDMTENVAEWKSKNVAQEIKSAGIYKKKIHAFLEQIKNDYLEASMGEKNTLFKLKELWAYMGMNCPDAKKALKRIRKSQNMAEYDSASREALEDFILF